MPNQLPLFVINLRRAPERRERMINLLSSMGLSPQIIDAVDGRLLDPESEAYWRGHFKRGMLNPGEVGCMLSHIAVWRKIVTEEIPQAVVLEDDLCFAPGFAAVVSAASKLQNVELVKLETDLARNVTIDRKPVAMLGKVGCHRLRGGTYRTGGYLIRAGAAARLLSASHKFRYALDVEMFDRRRSTSHDLTVHQLVPAICIQAELRPDLTSDEPYLQSSIQAMGERSDTVLGLNRARQKRLAAAIRRTLRPIKYAISLAICVVTDGYRGSIPFASDPQFTSLNVPAPASTAARG